MKIVCIRDCTVPEIGFVERGRVINVKIESVEPSKKHPYLKHFKKAPISVEEKAAELVRKEAEAKAREEAREREEAEAKRKKEVKKDAFDIGKEDD